MGVNRIARFVKDLGLGDVPLSNLHPDHLKLSQLNRPFVVVHHAPLIFGMQMPVMMHWGVVLLVELELGI